MLEIHGTAKTDSARPNGVVGLVEEGSAKFADPVKHPFAPAGTQRVALRNHQPTTLVIEEGDAEMRAPNVNGEYIIQKALRARWYVVGGSGMWGRTALLTYHIPPTTYGSSLLPDIAMRNPGLIPLTGQGVTNLFRDGDRAVTPTRATNRNGKVALAFLHVIGKKVEKQVHQMLHELPGGWERIHIALHNRVSPRFALQPRDIVWVGEKTRVENQVRVGRYAETKSKRNHGNQDGSGVRTIRRIASG